MENNNYLYTSGDFAKLIGVNKRTLHYYNDIGLFTPKFIGENGYHYYSVNQFAKLEMILTLRKIGISIEEITKYFNSHSLSSYEEMVNTQQKIIDKTINELLNIKEFLQLKSKRLQLSSKAEDKKIQIVTLPERRIVLSSSTSGKNKNKDISVAASFSQELKKKFNLYDSFGSRISMDNINNNKYDNYECYYAYCPNDKIECDEILPQGEYLMAFNVGKWDKIPSLYKEIKEWIKDKDILLKDYAYEEGLNELTIENVDEYITVITIPIMKK